MPLGKQKLRLLTPLLLSFSPAAAAAFGLSISHRGGERYFCCRACLSGGREGGGELWMGRMLCTGSELGLSVDSTRARSCGSLDDPVVKQLPPPAAKTLTRTPSVCRDGGVPVAGSSQQPGKKWQKDRTGGDEEQVERRQQRQVQTQVQTSTCWRYVLPSCLVGEGAVYRTGSFCLPFPFPAELHCFVSSDLTISTAINC